MGEGGDGVGKEGLDGGLGFWGGGWDGVGGDLDFVFDVGEVVEEVFGFGDGFWVGGVDVGVEDVDDEGGFEV